jgi:tetratricopeptide (TPR) repeat protein
MIKTMIKNKWFYLVLLLYCCAVEAKPYIPSDKNEVLEKLPVNADLSSSNYKTLRTQLLANPNNVNVATKLARLYIERSRDEGDPRYLGYAQATLAPWWQMAKPPIEVIVLRATLYQSTHQFNQSLKDLDTALKLDPNNGQAWITRATILQVQGEYAQALKSCERLYALAPSLITLT